MTFRKNNLNNNNYNNNNSNNNSNNNNSNSNNNDSNNNNSNNNNNTNSVISSINYSEFSFNPGKAINSINKENNNNQINILRNKNNIIYKQMNTKIEDVISSNIIKDTTEIYLIIASLLTYNKLDEFPKFQKIYESSLNGDSSNAFHNFCDEEPNILVVVESDNNSRFGGYTKVGFSSNGDMKNDEDAFLFNINKMKIYKIKKRHKAIYCDKNYGPCFGDKANKGFWISNNYLKEHSFVDKTNGCFNNMKEDYELNQGKYKFTVKKLEIFKILI